MRRRIDKAEYLKQLKIFQPRLSELQIKGIEAYLTDTMEYYIDGDQLIITTPDEPEEGEDEE